MTIQLSTLSNGIRLVTHEMAHLESAALGVWVDAGSRTEDGNEHGISHLLEHMAFKGTETRSARDIVEQIECVGGELNASTGIETTTFYARVLKDDVDLALEILSDILANARLDERELRREQHVILQEIGAAHDSPDDRVFDLFQEAAFAGGQPIGRPILGTEETVTSFDDQAIRKFLAAHYRGPSMIIAAAGAVDHAHLLELTEQAFGSFSAEPASGAVEAHYTGGESRMHNKDLEQAQLILGFQGCSYDDPDYYAVQILAGVLGGGMSSRLFQEVREKHGLCYSVYAFHWGFVDTGIFGIYAATGAEDVKELCPVLKQELVRAGQDISDEEVERARAQIRASLLMGLESPATRAGQMARQIFMRGRLVPVEELIEKIDAVTAEQLRGLMPRILTSAPPTLAAIGPINDIPDVGEFADFFGAPHPARG